MKNTLRPFVLLVMGSIMLTSLIGLQQVQMQHAVAASAIRTVSTSASASVPANVGQNYLSKATKGRTTPAPLPHAQGSQLVDASGNPLLLRGAQIESPFNYIAGWNNGAPVSKYLNPNVFNAMVHEWNMNVLRLPISNWIYAKDPAQYLSLLDTVVQQANTAGLYVILDLHDDAKSGSPYGSNASLPKAEDLPFWSTIANHYQNNSNVMFDLYNEPHVTSWSTWLHGGGTMHGAKIVGIQDLVNAIRSTGAQQLIVVEAGAAGGSKGAGGWSTIGSNTINDANIMYSLHVYDGITLNAQQQDAKWGPILNHYPIYYGEWAMLVNGYGTSGYDHCKNIAPSQADQVVLNFLNYMTSRHANWSAWEFTPYHLIQDETTYTPTTLDIPWKCGDPTSHAGMGTLVKQFLTGN